MKVHCLQHRALRLGGRPHGWLARPPGSPPGWLLEFRRHTRTPVHLARSCKANRARMFSNRTAIISKKAAAYARALAAANGWLM